MQKIVNWEIGREKFAICIVVCIEIFLVCNCILTFFKPTVELEYEGEELSASNAIFLEQFLGEDRNGYYIDDSMVKEGENLDEYWIGIPKVNLGGQL